MIKSRENFPLEPKSQALCSMRKRNSGWIQAAQMSGRPPRDRHGYDPTRLSESEMQAIEDERSWLLSKRYNRRGARQVFELRGNGEKLEHLRREESRYRKYGVTGEEVVLLLVAQNGTCVGCKASFSEIDFCIDHDHDTGKVRGLLCRQCNIVLAHWMTPGKLRNLAVYLENVA